MSLTTIDDRPLTPLPTDLAEAARGIASLEALPVIASADAAGGSPLFYPGGYISWLMSTAAPGDYLKLASEYFNLPVALALVKILELLIKLAEIRARRRELDKESDQDILQQLSVTIYRLDEKEAIKHFGALATREGLGRARGLLYGAVTRHLEGHTAEANILFRLFEKAYTVRDPVARALVQHRFGKSLAATGDFSRSIKRYRATMKASGPLSAAPSEITVAAGNIFSAKSKVRELLETATGEVFIVDPYVGVGTLDCLRSLTVPVRLLTGTHQNSVELDFDRAIAAFTAERHQLQVRRAQHLHDRHLIFNDRCWLVGGSLKDAGKKPFNCIEIVDKAAVVADLEAKWQTGASYP